ncbi:MAG: hypothetical protein ACOX50_01555 [Patescibacteria group bacterium]|jgi:hypothetical protein
MKRIFDLLILFVLTLTASTSVAFARPLEDEGDPYKAQKDGSYVIKNYLESKVGIASFGGRVFAAYEVLDSYQEKGQQETINYDVWAVIGEYYVKTTELECPDEVSRKYQRNCKEIILPKPELTLGTAQSGPVKLIVQKTENENGPVYTVVSHKEPRDGGYYTKDIKAMFSSKAYSLSFTATNKNHSATVRRLSDHIKLEAERYFQENLLKSSPTPTQIRIPPTRKLTLRERIGHFIEENFLNIRKFMAY